MADLETAQWSMLKMPKEDAVTWSLKDAPKPLKLAQVSVDTAKQDKKVAACLRLVPLSQTRPLARLTHPKYTLLENGSKLAKRYKTSMP